MGNEPATLVTVRPEVPMGAFHGIGYVCTLGVVDALRASNVDAGVAWPFGVVDAATGAPLADVRTRAGYDEGMFATCEVWAREAACLPAADVLAAGITARVDAWAQDVRVGRAKAGPLAPILSDYYDATALMGRPVQVLYPNGNVMARGTFVGLDVWGRATLRTDDGREIEFAPEQASIRPA